MIALLLGLAASGAALALLIALHRRLAPWSESVTSSGEDPAQITHRLRRAQLTLAIAGWWAGSILLAAAIIGISVVASHANANDGLSFTNGPGNVTYVSNTPASAAPYGWTLFVIAGLMCMYGVPIISRRRLVPALARQRGITIAPTRQRRLALVPVALANALCVFGGGLLLLAVPSAGGSMPLIDAEIVVTSAVVLVIANALLAPLFLVGLRAQPLAPDDHARLMELSAQQYGGVRDIYVIAGAARRSATAMQLGILPRWRYILVSDYLLDNASAEEVDAIVAHELSHARDQHIAVGLLLSAAIVGTLGALVFAAIGRHPSGLAEAVAVVIYLLVVLPVAYLVVAALRCHLERRADAGAAAAVGACQVAQALSTLAQLNQIPLDTGRMWNLLTGHPSIGQRLRWLGAESAAPT